MSEVSATSMNNLCCWHFCRMEQKVRLWFREGMRGVGVYAEKHRDGLPDKSPHAPRKV